MKEYVVSQCHYFNVWDTFSFVSQVRNLLYGLRGTVKRKDNKGWGFINAQWFSCLLLHVWGTEFDPRYQRKERISLPVHLLIPSQMWFLKTFSYPTCLRYHPHHCVFHLKGVKGDIPPLPGGPTKYFLYSLLHWTKDSVSLYSEIKETPNCYLF